MHPADIMAALKKAGKTQTEIAEALCCYPSAISRVVHGQARSARIEAYIAELTGLPVDILFPPRTAQSSPIDTPSRQAPMFEAIKAVGGGGEAPPQNTNGHKVDNFPMEFPDRLRSAIAMTGASLTDFSAAADLPYASLRSYVSGTKLPGLEALGAMLRHLPISAEWLVLGGSQMARDSASMLEALEAWDRTASLAEVEAMPPADQARLYALLYHWCRVVQP